MNRPSPSLVRCQTARTRTLRRHLVATRRPAACAAAFREPILSGSWGASCPDSGVRHELEATLHAEWQ